MSEEGEGEVSKGKEERKEVVVVETYSLGEKREERDAARRLVSEGSGANSEKDAAWRDSESDRARDRTAVPVARSHLSALRLCGGFRRRRRLV